jgi:hypothetical protein
MKGVTKENDDDVQRRKRRTLIRVAQILSFVSFTALSVVVWLSNWIETVRIYAHAPPLAPLSLLYVSILYIPNVLPCTAIKGV